MRPAEDTGVGAILLRRAGGGLGQQRAAAGEVAAQLEHRHADAAQAGQARTEAHRLDLAADQRRVAERHQPGKAKAQQGGEMAGGLHGTGDGQGRERAAETTPGSFAHQGIRASAPASRSAGRARAMLTAAHSRSCSDSIASGPSALQ